MNEDGTPAKAGSSEGPGLGPGGSISLREARLACGGNPEAADAPGVCDKEGVLALGLWVATDPLTGLGMRPDMELVLERAMASSSPNCGVALLLVGLDNFRRVNEALGYGRGDEALRYVASVLEEHVRLHVADSMLVGVEPRIAEMSGVFRLCADQFAVVHCGVRHLEHAMKLAADALAALARVPALSSSGVRGGASASVVLYPGSLDEPSQMVWAAECALREAKTRARGSVVAYNELTGLREAVSSRLGADLLGAAERREFFVEFQPKYSLADGCLVGMEALVRWQHPRLGVVMPGRFIGMAERMGLVEDIGAVVLEDVIRQIAQWRAEGRRCVPVAVNVSALQLHDDRFVRLMAQLLRYYDLPGNLLQVEITESIFAEREEGMRRLVEAMVDMGVTVGLDDFGKGYSSLSMLQSVDIETIKVDRSFVKRLRTQRGREVMRAIVQLGHALDMKVVAEGVEDLEQERVLRGMGCDQVQGFLYSMPRRASQMSWGSAALSRDDLAGPGAGRGAAFELAAAGRAQRVRPALLPA